MEYLLGMDGGGTRTSCLIVDEDGSIIGYGVGGPSNYLIVGKDGARRAIAEALKEALDRSGFRISCFKAACFGMAGVGRPAGREVMKEVLKELNISADKVFVDSDAFIALAGATVCNPGVIVVAGTGSIAFGLNERGEVRRAGGWGHILGDEGSAYDIGRKALNASFRAYDKRGEETTLLFKMLSHFKASSIDEVVIKVYANPLEKHMIAAAAPLVVEAAREGDRVALRILEEAGRELGLAAATVARGLGMEDGEFEIAITGGVFNAGDLVLNPFKKVVKKTAPRSKIINPRFSPVVGAIFIALKEAGLGINEDMLRKLRLTWSRVEAWIGRA